MAHLQPRSVFLIAALTLVADALDIGVVEPERTPSLRKPPPSSCKNFKQPSMWLRHTRLFEVPKMDLDGQEHEEPQAIQHTQHFTVACRPVVDIENRLGIPWHIVLTRANRTDNEEVRAVLRRVLPQLGFRHLGIDGDVLPSKYAGKGLRAAFEDRLPDTLYMITLPHVAEHCLDQLPSHDRDNAERESEALRICRNRIHRAYRWSKGQQVDELISQYNFTVPVDRLDEGMLLLAKTLQLELSDVLYIRKRNVVRAMSKEEEKAKKLTGVSEVDYWDNTMCVLGAQKGWCKAHQDERDESISDTHAEPMRKYCAHTCRLMEKYLDEGALQMQEAEEKRLQEEKDNEQLTDLDIIHAPDEDAEHALLDPDEVTLRKFKAVDDKDKRIKEDKQIMKRAMHEFLKANQLDYQLLAKSHAKMNTMIAEYGDGFAQDLQKFRKMMLAVNTECRKLPAAEEDACIRQVVDRGDYGDL